ncbi:MAG: hypothetical protein AB2A00_14965 [Myxococcota bacterium]
MHLRHLGGAVLVALFAWGCYRVTECETPQMCAEWSRSLCQTMDLAGTWRESGRAEGENSALRVEDQDETVTDVTVTWERTTPYDGEERVLDSLLWPPERSQATGTLILGDDDARHVLGDNVSPRTGVTRLVVQSRVFGCRPAPPQRFCEVRYVMILEGNAGESELVGQVEIWKETQTAPLERTITRTENFPVRFTRDTPLQAASCTDGGVADGG